MTMSRHYTVGAVAPDLGALKALEERLEAAGVAPGSLVVLSRRRDERLIGVTLPDARLRAVESGLSRIQWLEFASAFLGVTAVSVLMGAVHLATGLAVQSLMTLAAAAGLLLYHRRPRLEKNLLSMGLPEELAERWTEAFQHALALTLVTVPAELFDEAQDAFLEDESLQAPQAVDRRLVI